MDPHLHGHVAVQPLGEQRRLGAALGVLGVLVLAGAALGASVWLHNGLVSKREAVDAAWAQVDSNYQRRADLIPVLVEAVERYMRHESGTLERVVAERNSATEAATEATRRLSAALRESGPALAATAGRAPATEAELAEIQRSQMQIGRGIRQVLALAESYPVLRSADHFLELQAQLEGTENRINLARMGFNEAVRAYNAALEQIPTSTIAQARGYERKAYFEVDGSTRRAASLGFD